MLVSPCGVSLGVSLASTLLEVMSWLILYGLLGALNGLALLGWLLRRT